MLITYYEDGKTISRGIAPTLLALILANVAFAFVIMFAWTYISFFVAEPLSWAIWMPVQRGYGMLGIFEYPFLVLWSLPMLGAAGAWVAEKGGNKSLAYACVVVPLSMLLLVFGWYYLTPPDWR